MALILRETLWRHPGFPGLIAVTTNSIVNVHGLLIMGRGSAGDACKRIPGIQRECTEAIRQSFPEILLNGSADYGFVVVRPVRTDRLGFGIFQAKRDWRDVSGLATLSSSFESLRAWAVAHPEVQIRCAAPGLGCGQIGRGQAVSPGWVLETCRELPVNVTFCRRP